jgi:antitoxin (DNA-binding transcriptional repressor) of toxin-antitoxin stability system
MKSVDVADLPEHLGEYLEAVQNGESITIVAGTRRLALLAPAEETEEEYFKGLVREGKIERGTGQMPDDFLTRPLPKFEESVLEQFLEDRRTGR